MISLLRRWHWRLRNLFYLAPAAIYLVAACFFVFAVQTVSARVVFAWGAWGHERTFAHAIEACFALNWGLLKQGFFWQPFTYALLHGGWGHLLMNTLVILLFGAGVEAEIGSKRFLRIFFFGSVLGGLGWMGLLALMPYLPPMDHLAQWVPQLLRRWMPFVSAHDAQLNTAMCVGASGGVFALIGAFAAMFPKRVVYLLIPIPMKLKARTLAIVLGFVTVAEAIAIQSNVAYAAHLAGGLAGYFYGVILRRKGFNDYSIT